MAGAIKGLAEAPGAIIKKIQNKVTIYLEEGIECLTVNNRTQQPVRCYPGTSAVIPALADGRPESGWLQQLSGKWSTEKVEVDSKNRDVFALDAGVAKFSTGRSHVVALPGTIIVVAEGESLGSTVGTWTKVSAKPVKAAPAPAAEPVKASAK